MRFGFRCVSVIASACMAATPSQHAGELVRDRLQVTVAAPKDRTIERVLTAFAQENLTVASLAGGIVTSELISLTSIGVEVANITYTATAIGIADTASLVMVVA